MQMKWVVGALALLAITQVPMLVGETLPASGNEIYAPELFSGLSYRTVGPSRAGRVTAVAGHRDQPSTFYMGASGGGVWKTTDYGHNWHPISDGYFATGSIGAIRVAESDPNIVYVATGSDRNPKQRDHRKGCLQVHRRREDLDAYRPREDGQ